MAGRFLPVCVLAVAVLVGGSAVEAQNRPRPKTPQAWTVDEAVEQAKLNPGDAYLQYVALQLARNENRAGEVANEIRGMTGRGRLAADREADLFALFTAAHAVQETLQLDTMRADQSELTGRIGDPSYETVKIATLQGPDVPSHPWGKMLAAQTLSGKTPEVSPLAMCVPQDQYFVLFGSVENLLEASELSDLWGAHLFSQAARSAKDYQTSDRLKGQLAVMTDPLSRPFYGLVVDEVAITGSDLYFREGTDTTLLFQLKQPQVFRLRMDGYLEAARKSRPDAVRATGEILGVGYVHVGTPDRQIHVFSAYPKPHLHVRTNSEAALTRVLETIAGKTDSGEAAPEPLGQSTEFKYIRTLMPRGAEQEDGFVYLSDPFIRRIVGPELKLTERRRMLCYNHLRMIGHAAMLYRTQYGRTPPSLEALAQEGCAPGVFGEGNLRCPDGGRYRLVDQGTYGTCSHHGHARSLVPCREVPVAGVTEQEARQYGEFVDRYRQYWRRFFDPIAVRFQITSQRYRAETIILPLIDNSIYTGMAAALGGEPKPLDALPVPKRNIFSIAVKLDKARILEEAGLKPPTPGTPAGVRAEADVRASALNLRQIGLAMHYYHDVHEKLPAVANFDRSNRPLLSWRVHLLPFLGQPELYEQFHLDEPWDSKHNRALIQRMPQVYASPGRHAHKPGMTTYVVPVGPATVFPGANKQLSLRDIRDGTSSTILLLDAAERHAVVWTKPDDLAYDSASIAGALFGRFGEMGLACFADGGVRRLPRTLEEDSLDALFTRDGKEVVRETGRLEPSLRRGPFEARWLVGEPRDERLLYDFLAKGVGDQVGMHVYDSPPTFDFDLTGFLGEALGRFGVGRIGDETLYISFLVASLNSPVYVSVPVEDAAVVDRFLEHLDALLAALARAPRDVGFLELDFDFYRMPLEGTGELIRCCNVALGPVKWRMFYGRIGGVLYVASKRFILEDLAAMEASRAGDDARDEQADPGPPAHAMVRIRPNHWVQVLPDFRLGWEEASRQSCLNNLGPVSSVARAVTASSDGEVDWAEILRRADDLHAVHFFCPDGGRYQPASDGKQVLCTVHGSAALPRQLAAPAPKSPLGRVLEDFGGLTLSLTFLEDGLHAVAEIKRK